jgi:hypothetical protein
MLLLGAGLGLTSAPATESIMGSLPRDRAEVGSAVNDTAREVGGALGVAIIGSVMSSIYRSHLAGALPKNLPAPIASAAHDSLGAALQVSSRIGPAGGQLAAAARDAFVSAMSRASLVAACVAALAAVAAWRYLPAKAVGKPTIDNDREEPAAVPWYIRVCACSYGRTCECLSQCAVEQPAS